EIYGSVEHSCASDTDIGIFSATDNDETNDDDIDSDAETVSDPSTEWSDVHENIAAAIQALGGKVVPKLNWSAPKDATWINATISMDCQTPNDIYLMLKSSDFITHDLEHPFDAIDMARCRITGGIGQTLIAG
ncbi:unnamed protein product, partial [Sphagnum compactum]